ncbi:MAG: hypothetical protein JXM73_19800 [Anaerolineae bacterium]|nr:hypothetical protein [Anaerolineae bacterium]
MKNQSHSPRNGSPVVSSLPARLLLLLALIAGSLYTPPAVGAQPAQEPQLLVLRSDAAGTVLEVRAPDYRLGDGVADGAACQMLSAAGLGQTEEAGRPTLPVLGIMIGLPPGAAPEIRILQADYDTLTLTSDLCPAPTPVVRGEPGPDGDKPGGARVEMVYARDAGAYATNAFYPASLAVSAGEARLRDQRLLQLSLRPFQYNPATRELRVYRTLQVEVSFAYPQGRQDPGASGEAGGPFETTLQHAILNYDAARQWRQGSTVPGLSLAAPTALAGLDQGYKVAVNQDGLYQLTYADLAAAGLPVDALNPQTFQLFDNGQEVAIQVTGQEDGQFGPDDRILFYGQALDTKYTDTNIYWLAYGAAAGLRMGSRDVSPSGTAPVLSEFATTAHLEQNLRYVSKYSVAADADHWFWNYVYPPSLPSQTYPFTLNALDAEPYTAVVRLRLQGGTSLVHSARVYVNGNSVAETTWEGYADWEFSAPFPSAYLQEGTNTVQVEGVIPAGYSYDYFYFDWFEVDYRRRTQAENDLLAFGGGAAGAWHFDVEGLTGDTAYLYDVTNPLTVTTLTGYATTPLTDAYSLSFEDTIPGPTSYLALAPSRILSPLSISADAPSGLKSPDNGADYLVITHADFYAQAQQLADYRQGQPGIARTRVVDVQDIYDDFNDGELSAEAIHQFLQYAYSAWQSPAPSYVVLLGDGHHDFRNYSGVAPLTRIPPYLTYMSRVLMGEAPSDNNYAYVSGDDALPDMYIGRLPADSAAEAQAMVDKIIAYETNPPAGDWANNVLLIADNPDSAGDFYSLSDDIASRFMPDSYAAARVYLGSTCPYENPAATCRQAILDGFGQGSLLSNYVGHGSATIWAGERMLQTVDVSALASSGMLPVQLSFACLTAYFGNPDQAQESIDEALVAAAGRGAIASWGNSDMSYAFLDQWANEGFYEAVFQHDIRQLGPAAAAALTYYSRRTDNELLLKRKHLFGDPALTLAGDAVPEAPEEPGEIVENFEVMPQGSTVRIAWQTASEEGVQGFYVYRTDDPERLPTQIGDDMIPCQDPDGAAYELVDEPVAQGVTYRYLLEVVGADGSSVWSESTEVLVPYTIFLPLISQ